MKVNANTKKLLIELATKTRNNAYAPYSHYLVGAALITNDGKIFTGCNCENASYGLTNCAERSAVFRAVAEGYRHIDAIAIVGGPLGGEMEFASPCGACRQVLAEFADKEKDMEVIVARSVENYKDYQLSELLPESFKL